MKKMLFIYNPHSGKGLIKENLSDILNIFCQYGYHVDVRVTQRQFDAKAYIENTVLHMIELYVVVEMERLMKLLQV